MQTGLLHIHSFLRWIILLLLLIGIFQHLGAGNKPFSQSHRRTGLFLIIAADIELLIGLVQWFTGAFGLKTIQDQGMAAVMKNATLRFFAVEHIVMMLIAVILIHIGNAAGKKNIPDNKKHRKMALFFVLALIVILAAIPWPFREIGLGRGWL